MRKRAEGERRAEREALGKRLLLMRTRASLSQAQAAESLGIRRQTMTAWEAGDSEPPALDLQRMADLYGVDINVLTGRALLPLD